MVEISDGCWRKEFFPLVGIHTMGEGVGSKGRTFSQRLVGAFGDLRAWEIWGRCPDSGMSAEHFLFFQKKKILANIFHD